MNPNNKLKELRTARGLTQAEMAKRLGYKGKSGYCMLENGQVRMTLAMAQKIAEVLGVDANTLFFENKVQAC
jgi:transcriptional regulator with XRE-family HTH domain